MNDAERIRYRNRQTGALEEEHVFGERGLRFLYGGRLGGLIERRIFSRDAISHIYGWLQRGSRSRARIRGFAEKLSIDVSEAEHPLEDYPTLDAFFCRKLRPGARPVDTDPDVLVSPADGRVLVLPGVHDAFQVKQSRVTLAQLIGDQSLASRYVGGDAIVVRLCPADYHRFHFPDGGVASETELLSGPLHSVHPIALAGGAPSFRNKRTLCRLQTAGFGELLIVEVGAMLVGSIEQTYTAGPVRRGDEKGTFHFGGSTVVLVAEPGRLKLDADLIEASRGELETLVRVGTRIACRA